MGTPSARRPSVRSVAATRSATRITVSTFGTVMGLAGIEHGVGEVLQGNVAPEGVRIQSWPDSEAFDLLLGEPAITIVPNLLLTGVLAILVSLLFIVWATLFVHREHGGLVLILLSVLMILVGGGQSPPIFGVVLGIAATRINAPLTWWRTHLSERSRRLLAKLWPWALVAGVIAWLLVLPGTVLLDSLFDVSEVEFVAIALSLCILSAVVLLLVTIFAGLVYDAQRRSDSQTVPFGSGRLRGRKERRH